MKIKISVDVHANRKSRRTDEVELSVLGFENLKDWQDAAEHEKFCAVEEYFNAQGVPEYNWEEPK